MVRDLLSHSFPKPSLWCEAAAALLGLILALLLLGTVAPASLALGFSDVPAGHPFATAIDDLSSRGIITGFDDGSFRPSAPVTRQQFAKMVVGALYLPASTADICPFPDVISSRGADLYPDHFVAVAAANEITEGYGDGMFRPYTNISRAHVITMVVRALKSLDPYALQPDPAATVLPGEWGGLLGEHRDNASLAYGNGLLEGLDCWGVARDPLVPMPRGEVAQVLHGMKRLLPGGPEFRSSIQELDDTIKANMLRSGSWKPGVPTSFAELRLIARELLGIRRQGAHGAIGGQQGLGGRSLRRVPQDLRGPLSHPEHEPHR